MLVSIISSNENQYSEPGSWGGHSRFWPYCSSRSPYSSGLSSPSPPQSSPVYPTASSRPSSPPSRPPATPQPTNATTASPTAVFPRCKGAARPSVISPISASIPTSPTWTNSVPTIPPGKLSCGCFRGVCWLVWWRLRWTSL